MKLLCVSGLLLGAAVNYVYASHIPFSTNSSGIHFPTDARFNPEDYCWQALPHGGSQLEQSKLRADCTSQSGGNKCNYVLDGFVHTYWQSDCTDGPNNITIDLGEKKIVNGLSMVPHLENNTRGQIADHEVYLKDEKDEEKWSKVAYGRWGWNKGVKLAVFEPEPARFVRLVARSENGTSPTDCQTTSIVDIRIYAADHAVHRNPSKGLWGPTLDFPVVPVAGAHVVGEDYQKSNIMLWSAWSPDQFFSSPGSDTLMTTWDPSKEAIVETSVAKTEHDMFCPGISMDAEGNIVVSGGADEERTSIFNGTGWVRGPSMKIPRGYHATTTLSDGRIFAIGGSWNGGTIDSKDGEIYNSTERSWKKLRGIPGHIINTKDRPLRRDNHAWLFGWKNGSVFHAGPSVNMNWFNTQTKGGTYVPAGRRLNDQNSMSGNAVMYDAVEGKILTFGGQERYDGSIASRNAYLITIDEPYRKPKVEVAGLNGTEGDTRYGGMFYQRVFHTSVVLPDGSVFITGGEIWGEPFNEFERDIQLTPEIYYPQTDTFVPLQKNNIVRVYHSVSILLPDATVFNGGGGLCGNCTVNHYDGQIFTPPYLLNSDGTEASRPKTPIVHKASRTVTVGEPIVFRAGLDIRNVSLVRLGTVSHTVNTDQRRIPLDFKCGSITYNAQHKDCTAKVNVPSNSGIDLSGIVLPGHYMLFVLNSAGVPSKAAKVKVQLPHSGSSIGDNYLNDEEQEEEEQEEDCDMDVYDDKKVQGTIDIIFEATRKFWNTQKSTLVTQG